jgi:hypothetical protein
MRHARVAVRRGAGLLRGDRHAQAFLDGEGAAAIGAILGSATVCRARRRRYRLDHLPAGGPLKDWAKPLACRNGPGRAQALPRS